MPSQEDIANQQELLAAYRRTLAQLLKQQALISELFTPPAIANGIDEARENIRRLKTALRGWGVPIDDLPTDDAPAEAIPPMPRQPAEVRARSLPRVALAIGGVALIGVLGALAFVLFLQPRPQSLGLKTTMYWSQCATSAVWVLPGTISPAQDPDHAREQIAQAIAAKTVTSWQVAGLDPAPILNRSEPRGERELYMTVKGAEAGKINIHLFNRANVSVATQPNAQHLDVATFWTPGNGDCPSGGGGANNRTFPPTDLAQQAQQYADDKLYAEYDYFTLTSEQSEVLVFPFECRSPGTYAIQISLRYRDNINEVSGVYSSPEPATIVCPTSFTYWPITYARTLGAADQVKVQLGAPLPYHWDGKRYTQGAT